MGEGEEGLWHRSVQGQGDAFGVLYDLHRDRVFRHAYRLCGNHHDAEDVMAASFLELWRRRKQVRIGTGGTATRRRRMRRQSDPIELPPALHDRFETSGGSPSPAETANGENAAPASDICSSQKRGSRETNLTMEQIPRTYLVPGLFRLMAVAR